MFIAIQTELKDTFCILKAKNLIQGKNNVKLLNGIKVLKKLHIRQGRF